MHSKKTLFRPKFVIVPVIGLLLFCLEVLPAHAAALEGRNNPYGKPLTMQWKTEATNWGEGISSFTVITVMPTAVSREAVELMQRLPIKVIPIQAAYNTYFHKEEYLDLSQADASRIAGEASLSPADAILVGKVAWGTFPAEVRYNLLKKVKEGAGLVVVNPVEPLGELTRIFSGDEVRVYEKFLTNGILDPDLKPLALSSGNPEIKMFSFGKGRVLLVKYPDNPVYARNQGVINLQPFTTDSGYKDLFPDESLVRYDYQVAALARQVLWAARFTPTASIDNVETKENSAQIYLSGDLKGKKIRVRIRDLSGRVYLEKEYSLSSRVEISFPKNLPAGNLFLDARLPGCGWYTATFSVSPEIHLVLSCQPKHALPGDKVQLKAVVASSPSETTVSLHVYDIYGSMVVKTQTAVITGPEYTFSFSVPLDVRSDLLRLEAVLSKDGRVRARCRLNLPVNRPFAYDDYYLHGWGELGSGPPNQLSRQKMEIIADIGVNPNYAPFIGGVYGKLEIVESNRITALRTAEYGMKCVPYLTWIGYHGDSDIRSPGLYDPLYRSQHKDSLSKSAAEFAPYGPPWYSLGDEICLSGNTEVDFSEATRQEFEKYLKKKYRNDLSAVNTAWGTQLTGWDKVSGIKKEEALKNKEFGQWLDFRMFMYQSFSDFLVYSADCVRSVDAAAKVGSEGTSGSLYTRGFRWDTILPWYGGFFPYTEPHTEDAIRIARSFMKPDTLRGGILGSYDSSAYGYALQSGVSQEENYDRLMRYQVWFYMSQNMNAAFWWVLNNSYGTPGPSGLAPDLTPLPFFQAALQEINFLKSGPAKLLLNSTLTDDRVAMLYSPLSTIMDDAVSSISWKDSAREFCHLLENAGIQYSFLSEDDLAAGKLDRARFDFLVTPASVCLEDASVKAMRDFCKSGGKVIADFYPGTRFANGRLRNPAPFEKELLSAGLYLYKGIDGQYRSLAGQENGRLRLIEFKNFLAKIGLKPWYELLTPEGLPARAVISATFQGENKSRYLLLLSNTLAPGQQNLTLTVPAEMSDMHVYNLRTGSIIPSENNGALRITLKAGIGELLGFLPYRVKSLTFSSDRKKYLPGDVLTGTITLAADSGKSGYHVVSFRLFRPDGKEAKQYFTKIPVRNGKGIISISIPYNALPGTWKCDLKDATSGKIAGGQFLVESGDIR